MSSVSFDSTCSCRCPVFPRDWTVSRLTVGGCFVCREDGVGPGGSGVDPVRSVGDTVTPTDRRAVTYLLRADEGSGHQTVLSRGEREDTVTRSEGVVGGSVTLVMLERLCELRNTLTSRGRGGTQ